MKTEELFILWLKENGKDLPEKRFLDRRGFLITSKIVERFLSEHPESMLNLKKLSTFISKETNLPAERIYKPWRIYGELHRAVFIPAEVLGKEDPLEHINKLLKRIDDPWLWLLVRYFERRLFNLPTYSDKEWISCKRVSRQVIKLGITDRTELLNRLQEEWEKHRDKIKTFRDLLNWVRSKIPTL